MGRHLRLSLPYFTLSCQVFYYAKKGALFCILWYNIVRFNSNLNNIKKDKKNGTET